MLRERPDLLRNLLREPATHERFCDPAGPSRCAAPTAIRSTSPAAITTLLNSGRSLREGTVAGT